MYFAPSGVTQVLRRTVLRKWLPVNGIPFGPPESCNPSWKTTDECQNTCSGDTHRQDKSVTLTDCNTVLAAPMYNRSASKR